MEMCKVCNEPKDDLVRPFVDNRNGKGPWKCCRPCFADMMYSYSCKESKRVPLNAEGIKLYAELKGGELE